jgi:hypothetical protein
MDKVKNILDHLNRYDKDLLFFIIQNNIFRDSEQIRAKLYIKAGLYRQETIKLIPPLPDNDRNVQHPKELQPILI